MSVNEVVSHCPEDSDYDIESRFEAIGFHDSSPFLKRQVKSFSTLNVRTIGYNARIQRAGDIVSVVNTSCVADEFKFTAQTVAVHSHVA